MSVFSMGAVAQGLHLGAALILFGAALYPVYAPTGRFLDRPLRAVVRSCALVALVSELARVALSHEGPVAHFASILWRTNQGHEWLVRLALLLFAAFISLGLRRNSWTVRTQARVLAAVAAAILVSDAVGAQPIEIYARAQHPVALAIHLLGAGAWSGGTLALFIVLTTELRRNNMVSATAVFARFGIVSVAAVVVMLVGGVLAVPRIAIASAFFDTTYGRLLLLKLVLLGVWALLTILARQRTVQGKARSPTTTTLGVVFVQWGIGLAAVAASVALAAAR